MATRTRLRSSASAVVRPSPDSPPAPGDHGHLRVNLVRHRRPLSLGSDIPQDFGRKSSSISLSRLALIHTLKDQSPRFGVDRAKLVPVVVHEPDARGAFAWLELNDLILRRIAYHTERVIAALYALDLLAQNLAIKCNAFI